MHLLAQVKLEDVFQSTQESMKQQPGSERVFALVVGMLALIALLIVLQQRRKRQATPRPVNHHGRLLKEVRKVLPLKSAEVRGLKTLAQRQDCSNPLVLLLCPSLLAKAVQDSTPEDRKVFGQLIKHLGDPEPKK